MFIIKTTTLVSNNFKKSLQRKNTQITNKTKLLDHHLTLTSLISFVLYSEKYMNSILLEYQVSWLILYAAKCQVATISFNSSVFFNSKIQTMALSYLLLKKASIVFVWNFAFLILCKINKVKLSWYLITKMPSLI